MRIMAGCALTTFHRVMNELLICAQFFRFMAVSAELRSGFLETQHPHKAMRFVAVKAILLFKWLMLMRSAEIGFWMTTDAISL